MLKNPPPRTTSNVGLYKSARLPTSIFNGYYLECIISAPLLERIKKIIGKDVFKLYTPIHEQRVVNVGSRVVLPLGIFSHEGFVLECKNTPFTRVLKQPAISSFESNIALLPVQEKIVDIVFETCAKIQKQNKTPVYLNLIGECSIGKTIMALKIISEFGLKTFIVTPSIDLAKQWGSRIEEFMPNANYHVSTHGASLLLKSEINPDILLVPSKHLLNEEFNTYVANNFSICFVDEQHTYDVDSNTGMKHFFSFFSFPFVFSLTATPRRSNGIFLGREINFADTIKEFKPCNFKKEAYIVYIQKQRQISYPPEYKQLIDCKNKTDYVYRSLLKKKCLSQDDNRKEAIRLNVIKTYERPDAKMIILTHFVEEIDIYANMFSTLSNVFPIYAKTKNLNSVKESIKDLKKYILIGTEDHLGTGIDVKELNILHLTSVTTNASKIIQYAGRVSRDNPTPVHLFYMYNVSSYPYIKLDNDCKTMSTELKKKGWTIDKIMILTS